LQYLFNNNNNKLKMACVIGLLLLPAFQFQGMKWTGNSGSNPERADGDTLLLAVNDLTRVTARGVRAAKAFKSLSLGRTSNNCQVGRSFGAWFYGRNPRL
jgi:hypothetical protein